ncbi:hypothetical protein TCAL_15115 [Tigriopus californicus]|uniref:DNA (cytosine-5-)-methyltransferase n=1 Tax=Tigriopus californicus TaxID=6832 RepID=A0A553NVM4_TIGCA|nr:hypothetical protein TCAL_15115 [Tigriopus californicus]
MSASPLFGCAKKLLYISISDNQVERVSFSQNVHKRKKVEFVNHPIKVEGDNKFYDSYYSNYAISPIQPGIEGTPLFVGRVIYLCDAGSESIGHVQLLCRGQDTDCPWHDLGPPNIQLFEVVYKKVDCSQDWHRLDGTKKAMQRTNLFGSDSSTPHTWPGSNPSTTTKISFIYHEELWYRGIHFRLGDASLAKPEAYKTADLNNGSRLTDAPQYCQYCDPNKYPEFHRFKGHSVKGSHELTSDLVWICVIESIEPNVVALDVSFLEDPPPRKHPFGERRAHNYELYNNEMVAINPMLIVEKCHIRPRGLLRMSLSRWYKTGGYCLYFDKLYKSAEKQVENLSDPVLAMYADLDRPLQTLDVRAGCGGLSAGLKQSGVNNPRWAVENHEATAQAYQANNPECVVINDDSNEVLREVMDGRTTNQKEQIYPLKGQMELLAVGPGSVYQGFPSMNDRTSIQEQPHLGQLELLTIPSAKKTLLLKLCLKKAFLMMGYQCTFSILQAGHFGVPQTRRRCFLMAAAPGETLPMRHIQRLITCLHQQSCRGPYGTILGSFHDSAAYRSITMRDEMRDLLPIKNRDDIFERSYESAHEAIKRIAAARSYLLDFAHTPLETGSDWRDLPNTIQLRPGDCSRPNDLAAKGVCPCNPDKQAKCDLSTPQRATLSPWCLPHTANRHNDWSGLFGRISWKGFLSTTVSNPEPRSKQGRVFHPNQHRLVSARECARNQGFPNDCKFKGTIVEKYHQIGTAVPPHPPMPKAIGQELIQAIAQTQAKKSLDISELI